ncbi:NAD kinase [Actinocrinis puniceicyclus]|uniref:NAD kinase n=1 Tax=Actinocrinis puniceicyclus TaxID=977794 RepID=A0A8J8BE02_9ACTN|nr:NAD kinase [Actinocrinis puniceicyclus]MBS2964701.1 NAD kinase [Actinocrinis puniceicyclus]
MTVDDSSGGERPKRSVLLITHTGRKEAKDAARKVAHWLSAAGVEVRVLAGEVDGVDFGPTAWIVPDDRHAVDDCELVVVLGGDGTLLRGAELAREADIPLLGVNLGRVGFLAEAELEDLHEVVERIVEQRYEVEERMTLDVMVLQGGRVIGHTWALNEASVEKRSRARMIEVLIEIDGRPLSRWGCDGVVCATPTGSTAYAFSGGGPVVWPEVEALLLVPISAHALFARPLVAAPTSLLAVEIEDGWAVGPEGSAVLWCDGRRTLDLPYRARVEVRRGERSVRLARLHDAPFTDRLVAKFGLPVDGWRARD